MPGRRLVDEASRLRGELSTLKKGRIRMTAENTVVLADSDGNFRVADDNWFHRRFAIGG